MVATAITWKYYGSREALGVGCGAGGEGRMRAWAADAWFPGDLPALRDPEPVDGGQVAFTGLEVTYEGSTPLGDTTEMYNLA